jgi:hypothetical protein
VTGARLFGNQQKSIDSKTDDIRTGLNNFIEDDLVMATPEMNQSIRKTLSEPIRIDLSSSPFFALDRSLKNSGIPSANIRCPNFDNNLDYTLVSQFLRQISIFQPLQATC